MPKPKAKKPKATRGRGAKARLRKALDKQTKATLLDLLMEIASRDRSTMREIEDRLNVEMPVSDLLATTREEITTATDFDEGRMNTNFDYDHGAYNRLQKNMTRLVDMGYLKEAMELSAELMSQGSYQVEMSDEGLMVDEIESCLKIVIKAVGKSDLPPKEIIRWCKTIAEKDRVKFICRDQLNALEQRLCARRAIITIHE